MKALIILGILGAALYGLIQWMIRAAFRLVLIATVTAPVFLGIAITFNINERHWNPLTLFVLLPMGALAIYTWQTQGDTIRRAGYFQRVPDLDKRTEVRYR